eukprot:m51a1_g1353 putative maltose o-acetyltransferase (193) ;mRNA; r:359535-360113
MDSAKPTSQKDRMLRGELYDASDPQLVQERRRCRELTARLNAINASDPSTTPERTAVMRELFGSLGSSVYIEPPFRCDYGSNVQIGDRVYMNFDCVILDVCSVVIGPGTLLAPGVHIYAATHPVDPAVRAGGLECGKPVRIGSNVWVGGRTVICPGVTIGDNTTIGAGSVVTKDVPANVVAAGNPCRVIRQL